MLQIKTLSTIYLIYMILFSKVNFTRKHFGDKWKIENKKLNSFIKLSFKNYKLKIIQKSKKETSQLMPIKDFEVGDFWDLS